MTEKSTSSSTASVNFGWLGLLGVILVVLKLNPGGYLDSVVEDAPWWLVLLPFWFWLALLLLVGLIAGGAFGIAAVLDKIETRKRKKRLAQRHDVNRFK